MKLQGAVLAITGIGGFIGRRLAERALERGMRVRGIDQSPGAARGLEGATVVTGDVCDPEATRAACTGADVVVHTAAVVREDGPRALYDRVNVGGTATTVAAARAAGVRRFVQISSVMVYGFRYPENVGEDGPLRGEGNPYCETKIESEKVARQAHDPGRFDVTVIRPGDVYGPGSVPWVVRPFQMLRAGLFVLPSGGRGKVNHVHVDNLIDGLFAALQRDACDVYTVTDGLAARCVDFFHPIAEAAGRRRIRTVPASILRPAFAAVNAGATLLGRESPAAPSAIDYLMRPHAYSIEKARRDLGYVPAVGLSEGMARVKDWLKATYPAG